MSTAHTSIATTPIGTSTMSTATVSTSTNITLPMSIPLQVFCREPERPRTDEACGLLRASVIQAFLCLTGDLREDERCPLFLADCKLVIM